MNDYKTKKGTVYTEAGLPWGPRWFCDSRTAVQVDNESIRQIDHFGREVTGSYILFRKRFWEGMRFYLRKGASRTLLRPAKCEALPFGFFSEGDYGKYGLFVADERLFVTVTPKEDCDIDVEFYEDSLFRPETHPHKGVGLGGGERTWTGWVEKNGRIEASYEEKGVRTNVAISATLPISYRKTERFVKHILTLSGVNAAKECVLAFAASAEECKGVDGYADLLQAQRERYEEVSRRAPVLRSDYPMLDRFFEIAPLYHESLKVADVPGTTRAQTNHYFVWAWDSMTTPDAYALWGDRAFLGRMLTAFEENVSDTGMIPAAFTYDMGNEYGDAPPAAQSMYVTLLDLYRLAGGDAKKHYDFAKTLFHRNLTYEKKGTGLLTGHSLYPDFRELIGETGNDVSAFNNSVSYCAVRSMEAMATAYGDEEEASLCHDFAIRMKESFNKALWNEDDGYYASSADADELVPRSIPSSNAIKWENDYCEELIHGHEDALAKFFAEYFVAPAGLRPYPEGNSAYDADANQLHSFWPVMSELYARLLCHAKNKEATEQFIGWISYWAERLCCPEGISVYENTPTPAFDEWSAAPGIWHGYSARGFYTAALHCVVGVGFNQKGMRLFSVGTDAPLALKNLHFGDLSFDIEAEGSGSPVSVLLNGEELGAVEYIPFDRFEKYNALKITRG